MRTLKELMSKHKKAWLCIDDEVCRDFVSQCNKNGYSFNDGNPFSIVACARIMVLNADDKTVWYSGGMAGGYYRKSFNAYIGNKRRKGENLAVVVSYKAYISGESRYIINSYDEYVEP